MLKRPLPLIETMPDVGASAHHLPPATCPRAHDPESGRVENRPKLKGIDAHAALAHQNDFDVCWARGSVSELLFAPLVSHPLPADSALPYKQVLRPDG